MLANKGYSLKVLSEVKFYKHKNIEYTTNLKKLIVDQDIIIAPMSGTDKDGKVKKTFIDKEFILDEKIFTMFSEQAIFIIGIARPKVRNILKKQKIKYTEMANAADIAILNAIPTAEGAIKEAISETSNTIYGSKIMIFGLGKVGFSLAWRLKSLGAKVYAVTRSERAIARGKDLGIDVQNYKNIKPLLKKMDIFFNTVPALIINKEYINHMSSDAYIYDLASSPGGTDFKEAERKKINARLLPGLPGKSAPVFAGEVIAENIESLISRASIEEVN